MEGPRAVDLITCTPGRVHAPPKKGRSPTDPDAPAPGGGARPPRGTLRALARADRPANRQFGHDVAARGRGRTTEGASRETRGVVSTAFTWLEDGVYVALGILLALSAVGLLVHGGIDLVRALPRLD